MHIDNKGITLLSGGLDSNLAVRVCQKQGIEMNAISFETPFFNANKARMAAQQIGVPLLFINLTEEHLSIVRKPKYGYGRNLNPCIDCHALMVRTAGKVMEERGYDFIATGEVIGQRPMSQGRNSLNAVANESGYKDFLIRPLSAKLLKPSKPEIEGKVEREHLLAISGRGRKPQMALAETYGIKSYETPAGGCLLTEASFCKRLTDLFKHQPEHRISDVQLLPYGRHLRLNEQTKIIVGRNQDDNEKISALATDGYIRMRASHYPSPWVVMSVDCPPLDLLLAASICLFYSDAPNDVQGDVICLKGNAADVIYALPANRKTVAAFVL